MTGLVRCWRTRMQAGAFGLLVLGPVGCRHKPPPVTLQVPPPPSPVPLEPAPEPKNPPLVASVPTQPIPLPRVTVPPPKKPKKVKKSAPAVQVALANVPPNPAAAPDPSSVIGALTPGGEQVPERHQQAVELIAANDKRLSGLSAEFKEKQKEQLIRVQNFQKQAQTALAAGDAEGAYTLATKAKVLLDDLQK